MYHVSCARCEAEVGALKTACGEDIQGILHSVRDLKIILADGQGIESSESVMEHSRSELECPVNAFLQTLAYYYSITQVSIILPS